MVPTCTGISGHRWMLGLFLACAMFMDVVVAGRVDSSDSETVDGFIPKIWPAIVAIVAYGVSGSIMWYHLFTKGKKFMLPLTLGMTFVVIGFIVRVVYSHNPDSLGIYVITALLILLSPTLFLATDYILLTTISRSLGPEITATCLFIPVGKIVTIFVISDVTTFLMQAAGGGISALGGTSAKIGETIALIGLIVQLFSFSLFTILLLIFGWRVRKTYPNQYFVTNKTFPSFPLGGDQELGSDWRVLYFTVCYTCIGILIRSVFRIAEYAEGYFGFLAVHEGYFYALDSIPLWAAMTAYCFIWPALFVRTGSGSGTVGEEKTGAGSVELGQMSSESPVGEDKVI